MLTIFLISVVPLLPVRSRYLVVSMRSTSPKADKPEAA